MRLLLACDPLLPVPPAGYGGIERIVDDLIRYLRVAGHIVGLVAKAGSTCAVDAAFAWPDERIAGLRPTLRNTLALRRAVDSFHPDVVHSFARLAYLGSLLASNRPKIMSYQRHTGGRGVGLAARLGGRHLHFTGCSEFICNQGRRAGGTWTAIPNLVDLGRFEFAPTVAPDAPLLFLSRLDDIKGPDTAIAIAKAARRRLIIAGNISADPGQRRFFAQHVQPLIGRDRIEYVGEVGDAAKNELLRTAAALLVPIRWHEPFGIVFAEALACGTPVITCPLGALPEIVEPGRTGFFIASNDVAAGVAAIARLPDINRRACRAAAEKRFSLPVVGAAYEALYREVAGQK